MMKEHWKMHYGCGAALMLLLAAAAPALAQDGRCDAGQGKAVATLDELPPQVLHLLGRDKTGTAGIADIGGKFNPSDAIIDNSIPMRRLLGGRAAPHCIVLAVEYGGVGHYERTLEYRLAGQEWTEFKAPNAGKAPNFPLPARQSP